MLFDVEPNGRIGEAREPCASAGTEPLQADRPRRPSRRRRGVVWVLLAAGLGSAGWWYRDAIKPFVEPVLARAGIVEATPETGADQGGSETPSDPNVVTIDAEGRRRLALEFAAARTQRIVLPVHVPGTVAFDERRVTRLRPRTQGRVLMLSVQPGDPVKAGQTLATLDASSVLDARNGLSGAQANLGEAQAAEKIAELNLKRGTDLIKTGSVTQAEVDRRQVDLAKAHAATLSAKSQVDMYRAQYERLAPAPTEGASISAIVSPITGVVTRADITLGDVVDSNRDAFTVADPSQIQVLANLYGRDIAAVKPGDRATITAPVPAHPNFEGKVQSVNAAVDQATNTAPARIAIANPDGALRANMFVSVDIAADLGREGVTVPAAAIQQTADGPIVFVRGGEDRFERRAVTLGVQRSDWVEVTSGIAAGDAVVTNGSFGLKAILLRALLGSTN